MLATLGMLPPFAVATISACRGAMAERLAAVLLSAALAAMLIMLTSFAFDQSSFVDLGLTVALLAIPGTLLMAVFLERWL